MSDVKWRYWDRTEYTTMPNYPVPKTVVIFPWLITLLVVIVGIIAGLKYAIHTWGLLPVLGGFVVICVGITIHSVVEFFKMRSWLAVTDEIRKHQKR